MIFLSSVFKVLSIFMDMVGLGRFELPTSRLSGVRSNLLSYRPMSFSQFLRREMNTIITAKKSNVNITF